MIVIRLAAAAMALAAAILPAAAEEGDPVPPPRIAFRPAVERAIDTVILPAYERLGERAAEEAKLIDAFCAEADEAHLAAARDGFRDLVTAWSGVEMFRFGPAREANRYERLFFWPDPRGRGLRQVQDVIAAADATATDIETLQQKSVAVQGLLALEYVLFGTGSETLVATGDPAGAFRCAYGAAVAAAIAGTAGEILADWTKPDGYAALMREAGAEDPVYRSHGEVVQELLKAAREQLQLVRDNKLSQAIGETPEQAQPKRSPFWRSDMVIPAIAADLDAVVALAGPDAIGTVLPADKAWVAGQVAFELGRVDEVLGRLDATGTPWESLPMEADAHVDLLYTLIPLGDVLAVLETDYPAALGLITGFNSLDGD
jgi:predicted lipoprotein